MHVGVYLLECLQLSVVELSVCFRVAALRCRQKKKNFVTSLENKVAELQSVNDALEVNASFINCSLLNWPTFYRAAAMQVRYSHERSVCPFICLSNA